MAGSLNIQVTAVGVEDRMQLEFLGKRGCLEVQGKLFGSAMNAEEMTQFLKTSEAAIRVVKAPGRQQGFNFDGSRKIH
jgi:EAL domain-containing protein (putative c-di-GMP-specific phosphodiesterase class I)